MTAGGLIAAAAHASPAGIAAGVILGGLTGGLIGHLVDNKDKEIAAKTTHQALESAPSGKAVAWQNPDNGHTGTVTPLRRTRRGRGSTAASTRKPSPSTTGRSSRMAPRAASRMEAGGSSARP